MRRDGEPLRLLPWPGPEGKPCYLSTDGDGFLARLADDVEAVQLTLGAELLDHARVILSDPTVSGGEIRYLAARLGESLRDALRIAESRGGGPDWAEEHGEELPEDPPDAAPPRERP